MNRVSTFDRWEYKHFHHILELYDLFENHFQDIIDVDFTTKKSLEIFSRHLFESSSKQLTPYIQELTDAEKEIYALYKYERQ